MHALGFYHEHQRPDRDRFVNFNQTKISNRCYKAFELYEMNSNKRYSDGKFKNSVIDRLFHRLEYDHKSIMHYGGKKYDCVRFVNVSYMTLKPFNETIPDNKKLSALDIQTLKEFYAPPSK